MREIMKTIPPWALASFGMGCLILVGYLLKVFAQVIIQQVKQSLKESREEAKKEIEANQHEQEYDMYLLLRGLQVVTDLEHELVYCVMNGTHNGGLEKANKELDEYRRLSNENIVKKATKWNMKIDE